VHVWFFITVDWHASSQASPLMEYFIAFNTNVWLSPTKWLFRWGFAWFPYCIQLSLFLSTVSHHVTLQMSSTSEGYLTLVLFLPTMNKKVPFQTPSLGESIIALITIILFFSTLCKKMYLHLVWTADFFWCIHDIWTLSNTKILQLNNPWLAQFDEEGS